LEIAEARGGVTILLVEDNPADARLFLEALREHGAHHELNVVANGEDALRYLRGQAPFEGSYRPDLVVLDLNLPKKDGREVLAEIKQDPELKRIPVIVMTTSDSELDVMNAYDLHANCYVKKPVDLEEFIGAVRACENFWAGVVRLPSR
jgi:chemotaxis family two-component system response regulator Rcp1